MVVLTLGNNVGFLGAGHGEVKRGVLLVLVVVGVVLVSVNILGSHVMVRGVLVVMRSALVRGGVVAFVASVVNCGGCMRSFVVNCGGGGRCFVLNDAIRVGRSEGVGLALGRDGMRCFVVNGNRSLTLYSVRSFVFNGMNSFMVHSVRSLSMLRSSVSSLMTRSFMVWSGVRSLNVDGCIVMNGSGFVVNGCTFMSSNVVGIVMMNWSGVMSLLRSHMSDWGVELRLAVSHMGALSVTRLGCHLVGLLVVSLNGQVLHNGD